MDFIVGLVALVLILKIIYDSQKRKKSPNYRPTHQKQYGFQVTTLENVNVKSYSEKKLADYFTRNNIKYIYEPGMRYLHADPDFYLPEHDIYVEFWGLLDAKDPVTAYNYEKKMKRKMAIYHKNNIKFISIYPRNLENLDWVFRNKFEKVTGGKLPHNTKRFDRNGFEIDTHYQTCFNCGMKYDTSRFSKCPQCGSTGFFYKKI
ncbi:hypothetical protein ACFL0D_00610 [Thermoproteota archaeon]